MKALSSSLTEAGMFAEKLLNKLGLTDDATCACVIKVVLSNMHRARSLDVVFIVWNFGFSSIGQLLKRSLCIKNYTKTEKNPNECK